MPRAKAIAVLEETGEGKDLLRKEESPARQWFARAQLAPDSGDTNVLPSKKSYSFVYIRCSSRPEPRRIDPVAPQAVREDALGRLEDA